MFSKPIQNYEVYLKIYENAEIVRDGLLSGSGSLASPFSKILTIPGDTDYASGNGVITIDTAYETSNLLPSNSTTDNVFQFINHDIRSLEQKDANGNDVDHVRSVMIKSVIEGGTDFNIATLVGNQGLNILEITDTPSSTEFEDHLANGKLQIVINYRNGLELNDDAPIAIDIFTFGQDATDDTRYNDAIYRLEAEETANNSGVYTGTVEYIMLNQTQVYDDPDYL